MTRIESFGVRISVDGGGIHVFPSSTLERWPIRDSGGEVVAHAYGMLLRGHMGPDLAVENGEIRVKVPIETPRAFESIVTDNLHGILIYVTEGSIGRRVYPDFVFSIPLVYCPETRMAGGSANEILDDAEYDRRFIHERHAQFIEKQGGYGWIPGTMTVHEGVYRVLPNHYLDLDTFTAHRFWPREDEYEFGTPFEQCVEESARSVRSYIEACVDQYDCAMTLTAGYDSRVMLCAARNVIDRISLFTFDVPGAELDTLTAVQICADLGLRHEVKPIRRAEGEALLRWDRMVGDAVQDMNRVSHPTLATLPNDIILAGTHGAGKCFYYQDELSTINSTKLTAESVAARLRFPGNAEVIAEMAAWLKPISWLPSSAILDLALGEIRNGCWAMAQAPIQKAVKPVFLPHAQRSIWALWLEVHPEQTGDGELYDAACEILWPEALKIPRNRYGDYRDTMAKLAKLKDFRKVLRYIRIKLAT